MSELLPSGQVESLRDGLTDYLRTTFALADNDAGAALEEFLGDRENGIFKGPYLRLRLPFKAAEDGWRDSLDWYEGHTPYGHQAAAFKRLSSVGLNGERPRPEPTLVTTGTGSGKTEAFLYPIIDHVLRAKRDGITGMKALILYPMNALANDQAQRLATLISTHGELSGITAALYTGQQGSERTKVSSKGLITDRAVIRSAAPDIVLTNYKMLDQMLLRDADARIWEQSAHSLQYLVLDEFHTYDGAQGTDVTMLLRRLGLALKSHWGDHDARVTESNRARPLGHVTPVATSATLGDKGDPQAMLEFARTVFGDEFGTDAVVTESRLSADEWIGDVVPTDREVTSTVVEATIAALRDVDSSDGRAIAEVVLGSLFADGDQRRDLRAISETEMLDLVKSVPLTVRLVNACRDAAHVSDLAELIPSDEATAQAYLLAFAATLSHIRAVVGREALSVDLHLWIRELTRIDRGASVVPSFHWSDDGEREDGGTAVFPAVYCRHCGRSGWGVMMAPVGAELDTDDEGIRGRKMVGDERFRALIHAPAEGETALAGAVEVDNLRWFSVSGRKLSAGLPGEELEIREGRVLPVLTHLGQDAGTLSKDDWCPSCLRKDGIRFLGSAIATMLSVSLSSIFGTSGLDTREKKALVFTDSVQDAAHRAGFVQSRSHSLTLRAVIREAVADHTEIALDQLVDRIIDLCGDDPHRRYRVLPPDFADQDEFSPFWTSETLAKVPARVRTRVRRRLLFDVELEFGLQSRVGRTLELTGSVAAKVDAPPAVLVGAAQRAIDDAVQQQLEHGHAVDDITKLAWVRGVLERMRERGAIEHEWFRRYQAEDGRRYGIWGGRPRSEGMPAFPRGRAAPGYPRIGGAKSAKDSDLDPVTGAQSWYTRWAARMLGLPAAEAASLAKLLMERLSQAGVVHVANSESGAKVYQLAPSSIMVSPVDLVDLEGKRVRLVCSVCQAVVPGTPDVVDQLDGASCMVARCPGELERSGAADNFYRRMYESTDIQRVVAREHTSQLDDETRLEYENGFKASASEPQSPNVLVATPTLEMGIDIGDLSTVMLASLPRSVASYLQRVGRAGRLTGNALNLAFVTGRGDQLPRLGDPLSVINGEVRPPATYVDAEEILRRQYVASVADRLARDITAPHPRKATEAMNADAEDGFLRTLIRRAEQDSQTYLDEFLAGLGSLRKESEIGLREWATPGGSADTSGLAQRMCTEAHKWSVEIELLNHRAHEIENVLPELEQRKDSPAATDDDKSAFRTAKAALRLARKQLADLRGEYWIGVLESHGILPNYTLLDDSVELEVAFSWIDPDTGEFENEPQTFDRGASLALRDFAPGATFYARGHRIKVDAVELGHGGELVRAWVFCPACGYSRALADGEPGSCPRCGSSAFADVKQRVDVVELSRVSSAMRREEASIDDSSDERVREQFTVVTSADVHPEKVSRQWFVDGYGFGVRHLRNMTIQWTNVGKSSAQGSARTISGGEYAAAMFRVCSSCGQLDMSTRTNRASEHRPWCPQRRATEERTTTLALTRTLSTEGLVVRLPGMISLGDKFAVPSLSAALLLGLREMIGGAPDHLAVEAIVDPTLSDGGDNHDALLLHDIVPGGTGYLADLADAETFWSILRRAWEVVRDCPCQDENRLSCHRCLLPFAGRGGVGLVSRQAAERHLRDILRGGDSESELGGVMPWKLTDEAVQAFDPETQIEKKFRVVLAQRLEAIGATVTEKPGPHGNRMIIRAGGGRVWRLEPQQNVGPAKPDFVLQCDQPVPLVAIFCDGWAFHASPEINRLPDDTHKRQVLRDSGHVVLGLSWADLDEALDSKAPVPGWFDPAAATALRAAPDGGFTQSQVDVMASGAMAFLVQWIQDPDPESVGRLADLMPYFAVAKSQHVAITDQAALVDVARDMLDGTPPPTGTGAWIWSTDTVTMIARSPGGPLNSVEVAVMLDDRPSALGKDHRPAWREWLRLSNALNLRSRPTTIGVHSQAAKPSTPDEVSVPADWVPLLAQATGAERALLQLLAASDVDKPVIGFESAGGIPLDVSWPDKRLALDIEFVDDERDELSAEGWTLVPSDVTAIHAALAATKGAP
ncbi:DEAD/DEAH box helicase [Aeromicrobium sp. S22]|uniref:DEAD/DEAH box helicase n=1 Tax=Aeromicrobium sp. S22 TaxID=2662029 RepID=UPI00129E55F6|nr:DEAD/DEAH box helicase [Aeromicrobium sp. S22]MRK01382.1 DEAD/DEAH box helicase [Aeromicrobium sp. S22]